MLFYYGWEATYDQLCECAAKYFPDVLVYEENVLDKIATGVDVSYPLADTLGLPFLTLEGCYAGPCKNQRPPMLVIANNFTPEELRKIREELPAVAKLKEMVGFEGSPMWYVAEGNSVWPGWSD